jgi:hypothetical protein
MKLLLLSFVFLIFLRSNGQAINIGAPVEKPQIGSNNQPVINGTSIWSGVPFTFSLSSNATTSAGVFAKDGTLLRNLWSNVKYPSGSHNETWDGTDDEGRMVPEANYDIRVLSNNVTYEWEGVVGNTSAEKSGETVFRASPQPFVYFLPYETTGYYSIGYEEAGPVGQELLSLNDIQHSRRPLFPLSDKEKAGSSQTSLFIATDGYYMYWAGRDPYSSSNATDKNVFYVYASNVSDNSEVLFSHGIPYKNFHGRLQKSVIDYVGNDKQGITGLAVQKKHNFLFVSHGDSLHVLDKVTGVLAKSISMPVGSLAVDASDNLWILGGTAAKKYNVNKDGTLSTSALVTIAGFVKPVAITVSPANEVVVADAGTSQQLKAFNGRTGESAWVFGQKGGYYVSATVTNDKFYWSDDSKTYYTSIAFESDGSFWVIDSGNGRVQHYNANKKFIECIMCGSYNYDSFVDRNSPTRVFENYLEFAIDYSRPLAPGNGSWKLVNNWRAMVPTGLLNQYLSLRPIKLSNGKTYTLFLDRSNGRFVTAELKPEGILRFTNSYISNSGNAYLNPDGNIYRIPRKVVGQPMVFTRQKLIGFDAYENPLWGKETPIASVSLPTEIDPTYAETGMRKRVGEITSNSNLIVFNAETYPDGRGFHLGAVKIGDNKWKWRTARGTTLSYSGPFPDNGDFDIGNQVLGAGGAALAIGTNVFWNYHGEFWKSTQVNKWNHLNEDGLMIGQFGVAGNEVAGLTSAPQMAGNVFAGSAVKVGSDIFIYHNDEGQHGGVHRWKVSNLSSLHEQTIPVTLSIPGSGLTVSYCAGPDLNNIKTATLRTDPGINFNRGNATPQPQSKIDSEGYSTKWEGYIKPSITSKYTFYVNALKGVRLWVDNKLLIDHWNNTVQQEFNSIGNQKSTMPAPIATANNKVLTQNTIQAREIDVSSALISLVVSNFSFSQIEYGPTTSYGLMSESQVSRYNGVYIYLKNLLPGTIYHYRVITSDKHGNISKSADKTFETLPLVLIAGIGYPVRLEINDTGNVSLAWSGSGAPKEVISSNQFIPAPYKGTEIKGYNLTEGLEYDSPVKDLIYGWAINPPTEKIATTTDYWSVHTNRKDSKRNVPPELNVVFSENVPYSASVSRDLGTVNSKSWQISGNLNYDGGFASRDVPENYTAMSGTGGQFFDLVDRKGKIIFRMFPQLNYATKVETLYANGVIIAQDKQQIIDKVINKFFSFNLKNTNGVLTLALGNYSAKTIPLFDKSASINSPKKLQLYFWGMNNFSLRKAISLKDFFFKE